MALLVFHVLPSLVSGVFFLIIVSLIVTVFRIKHPTFRAIFYILILYKIVEAMFIKTGIMGSYFGVTVRVLDPLNIVPQSFDSKIVSYIFGGPVYNQIIVAIVFFCVALIVFRWIMLWRFYLNLSKDNLIVPGDCPSLDNIIDKYSQILKVKKPRVALSLKNHFLPAIIGLLDPVLVLSPKMIDKMSSEQLEVIIAHELSHIKRKDNYFHWLALVLRDLTFFNPVSHLAFNKYVKFKEIATNNLVMKSTEISYDQIIHCAEEVGKFVRENKIKELPSLSSAIQYKKKFKSEKLFNYGRLKILFVIPLFLSLAMIQCVTLIPLGHF